MAEEVSSTTVSFINRPVYPSSPSVQILTSSNFTDISTLELQSSISCCAVLFHNDNRESQDLITVYSIAASSVVGMKLCSINLSTETTLQRSFSEISSKPAHPLHWVRLKQIPFILIFSRWPISFYNGPRDSRSLAQYMISFSCSDPERYERTQLGIGVEPDDILAMRGVSDRIGKPKPSDQIEDRTSNRLYEPGTFKLPAYMNKNVKNSTVLEAKSRNISSP